MPPSRVGRNIQAARHGWLNLFLLLLLFIYFLLTHNRTKSIRDTYTDFIKIPSDGSEFSGPSYSSELNGSNRSSMGC